MTADIIDGKAAAARLRQRVGAEVTALRRQYGLIPGLAVVLVGEDPASQVYVRNKVRQTKETGMHSLEFVLPETVSEAELLAQIHALNYDDNVHGILVQLPLPSAIPSSAVIAAIAPEKDVDGFHPLNAGRLATGQEDGLLPCTPYGCMLLLRERLGHDLAGKHALVIGRSNIVGRPMAQLLLQANATVTIAHRHTPNVPELCKQADIVVVAVGRPQMVRGGWLKPGAVVLDVGINRVTAPDGASRLVGDVDFESARGVASAITPVPGGVGPMTIACLLANTVRAACRQRDIAAPDFNVLQAA